MRIVCIGGGPAGLYFAILMKLADPDNDILVVERNRPDDTFGFGVVFSDATLEEFAEADRPSYEAIEGSFYHWDDIDIHYGGECLSSTGHGFSGMSRRALLEILVDRCRDLGVDLEFGTEVTSLDPYDGADLIVAADGANSVIRETRADAFGPTIDERPNRFVWLGTTKPFPAFTFYFRHSEHGLWRVHAYQYSRDEGGDEPISTFIVEATEETWRRSGMDTASEEETVARLEALFAPELEGHALTPNRSIWRAFPTVRNACWRDGNVVLIGDAAHTAHFSIGSGTRLAMIDAIALRDALIAHGAVRGGGGAAGGATTGTAGGATTGATGTLDVASALAAYEEARRPDVESVQRAAQASLEWFEGTERFMDTPPIQFAFNLLTRSLRITHQNLELRDPAFTARVDEWFAREAAAQTGVDVPTDPAPPPLFTPFRLRDLVLGNRVVVSAMCQYVAEDGQPDDWHFVHLGSRAVGGAGLVMAEMTNVSREGRISPGCTGLYRPEHVEGWRRIVDFVHGRTDAKIGMQLGHAGRKGATRLSWDGDVEPLDEGAWDIVSASPIPWFEHSQVPREMTRADMDHVIDDYVRATEMSIEAGFDLLEIHFAHGYLLASFVSPLTNIRTDEYGGSLENRLRFPLEVFGAVRAAWPDERPVSVRISAVDWAPGGLDADGAVEVARRLYDAGVDIIDVSAGQTVPYQQPVYGRQFQTPFSDRIRNELGMPTMAVGNISSFMDVNTILAAGRADLCCLARAHLYEPYWTRHAAKALGYDLPWPLPYSVLDTYTPRFEWGY
ncbi:MAG: bifunctional salicylyl-CoA 5-hydroxylase/oxidoreductase [Gemmatimonadota bacterium]|nr:bifunctional salicylyl-CoA 5-hydroxylase/oxidoreductase [Gemmatimonadota bacterium]